MQVRKVPGTALANASTGEVIYTPPVGESIIRDMLANWETFIHNDSIDELIRLAVAHYQFEAIHPFSDGNGRTGRIINSLLLVEYGLLNQPILFLSHYILKHREDYYDLLRGITFEQRWEAWIAFMLKGIAESADVVANMSESITALMRNVRERIEDQLPKLPARDLTETVCAYPYSRAANIVEAGIAKRQTAAAYLQKLEDIGVVRSERHGRERIFINTKLVQILSGAG